MPLSPTCNKRGRIAETQLSTCLGFPPNCTGCLILSQFVPFRNAASGRQALRLVRQQNRPTLCTNVVAPAGERLTPTAEHPRTAPLTVVGHMSHCRQVGSLGTIHAIACPFERWALFAWLRPAP